MCCGTVFDGSPLDMVLATTLLEDTAGQKKHRATCGTVCAAC